MTVKKTPKFKTEQEEARFWDEQDTIDFVEDFEPVEIELDPELKQKILNRSEPKKPITIRLETYQIEAVKKIATSKGLPYQTLIRMWINEAIQKEKII